MAGVQLSLFRPTLPPDHRSDLQLKEIWINLRKKWFPFRPDLDRHTVLWSTRPQKRTLASCSIERKRIIVARELNYPNYLIWLAPLLYHEMCHAYLGNHGVSKHRGKFAWHGKEFKALEKRHPQIKALDYWIKTGGWNSAVRSDRAKRVHQARRAAIAA